jgi:hypothetical protein
VEVPAHRARPLHLHLPRRRREQVLLQRAHL